jgi:hypothetical protein
MGLSLVPLSPTPSYFGLYLFIAALVVFFMLIIVALIIKHKRLRKPVALVAIAVVAVAATACVVWSTEPTIEYWLIANPSYSAAGDNAVTVKCQNTGQFAGTFNLDLEFRNAAFSAQTSQPYTLLGSEKAMFTYTLQPGETQSKEVYFNIDGNATDFYLYLSFEQSGGNFLVRAEPGGVTSTSYQRETAGYQKDAATDNFMQRTYAPPP